MKKFKNKREGGKETRKKKRNWCKVVNSNNTVVLALFLILSNLFRIRRKLRKAKVEDMNQAG
jgi:hypothetical protein